MTLGLSEFRWYYGFLGAVLAVTFFSPAWKVYDRFDRGIVTDATVTEFVPRKTSFAGAMVHFTFVDNQTRQQTGSDTVAGDWYPPSDNLIRISYLPESPSQTAILDGSVRRLPIVLFCIGAGLVILAIWSELYLRHRRRAGARREKDEGEYHAAAEFRENE